MNPPTFEEAKNKRQKVRAAGLDPNHWYAVLLSKNLPRGKAERVTFWGDHVAVYRDDRGDLHALEDRCAHRHLPLSIGLVEGDRIRCQYHGWAFDKSGRLAEVPHDLFGMKMPQCRVRAYPIKERYGLIWVFFGDADRAATTSMPEIPELEGDERWACVPVDVTWRAHHSMIIDNVSDFTHEFLHRKYKPFSDAKLLKLETNEKGVFVEYDTKVGMGGLAAHFIDRSAVDTNSMKLGYEYPYQWSNTDDQIKHWLMVLPIDEVTTRSFYLFYFKSFKVPFTPFRMPRKLMEPIIKIANKVHVGPLLAQDEGACTAEQLGWEKHWDKPVAEISPAVHAFQTLTVKRWEDYLKTREKKAEPGVVAQPLNRDRRAEEAR
jgi:hypothetical protein